MKYLKVIVMLSIVLGMGVGTAQANGAKAGPTLWERPCIIDGKQTMMPPVLCKGRGGEVPWQYRAEM